MKTCSQCNQAHYAKGCCRTHYNQLPDVKAKKKAWAQSPNGIAYLRAWSQAPKQKEYRRTYYQKPETKARVKAYEQSPKRKMERREYLNRPAVQSKIIARWKVWAHSPKGQAFRAAYQKAWYAKKGKAYYSGYRKRPAAKAYAKLWDSMPYKKAYLKAYNQTAKAKAIKEAWENSPEGKAAKKKWLRSQMGRAYIKTRSYRRRSLGNDVINPDLINMPGFHGHHIDREHVLYIPKELHKSVPHSQKKPETMEQINTKAFAWLLGGI